MKTFGLFLLLFFGEARSKAAPPLEFRPFFQKIVTFYGPELPKEAGAGLRMGPPGTVTASDGAVWNVEQTTIFRTKGKEREFFQGRRYLPDGEITGLAADGKGGIWIRTVTGHSHIEYRLMKLSEKAAYFEDRIKKRHNRHDFVADCRLGEPGNLATFENYATDNDGLWTAIASAAEVFRYGVTRSEEALGLAKKTLAAVLFLEEVTGRPGYPARTYITPGEKKPGDGVWHWTEDRKYLWKGDTSSDEIVGHYFLFSIAWDLLPDAAVKQRVAGTARRIMDHILEHEYNLTDVHGEPTYWGRWGPDYFATGRGRSDSPLNAVELLSFLKTTYHITGDRKYEEAYRKVAIGMDYATIAARYLELRHEINYSDEELAMLSFYPLLKYEKDPKLLAIYRRALDGWWQNIQREKNPLWTFIYLAGKPQAKADLEGARWTLERMPMDLITWSVKNSGRQDLQLEPGADRFGQRQAAVVLAPDERAVMRWNANPFRLDGGDGGRSEDDGAAFLLPYWMARYHRIASGE